MSKTKDPKEADYLTIENLAEEVRPFFGQIVLMYRHEMAVLEGVGEDLHDLYYIARPIVGRPHQGKKPVWYSAVGHCEGLKQYLPQDIHDAILNGASLNGGLPETFLIKFDTGSEVLDYDPETHPALRRKLQKEDVERALARARSEDPEEDIKPEPFIPED